MKKSRKILSVVLAVVMLATCFSMLASAYTYEPTLTTGDIKFITEADETTVTPGQVVTFSLKMDDSGSGDLGGFNSLVLFNGDQLSPVGSTITEFRTWQGDCAASYANPNASGNMKFPVAQLANFMNEEEKAYFTAGVQIVGTSTSSASRWNPEPRETYVTFQMTVADSVQPGEEIWIGLHEAGFLRNVSGLQIGTKRIPNDRFNLTESMVKLTVASDEPAGPVVAKSKAEVKMTPNSPTTVEDAFQFRVTSVITDADWDTYFANTAAGGNNAITKLGFVAYKGTAGFDLETAKSVAKGGTVAGYDKAETTYVQKETDSSDAYFGAIIQITSAETRSDATYIAYVEYTDAEGATQYAFYDAAQTALLDTNYQTIVDSYLAAYPFAG